MTNKAQDLLNEIQDYFYINIKKNEDGSFFKDPDGNLVIEEDGHKQEGTKIRKAVDAFFRANYPDLYKKVAAHTGKSFYNSTERTPPFVVYFLAQGLITPEDYCQKIMEAPKDAEVVANYIEEAKFKETIYKAYELWDDVSGNVSVDLNGFKFDLKGLSADKRKVLDTMLDSYGLPKLGEINKALGSTTSLAAQAEALRKAVEVAIAEKERTEKDLAKRLAKLTEEVSTKVFKNVEVKATGEIPNGKVVMKSVKDIFPGVKADFQVPFWEWDGPHPDVPAIDDDYIFREDLLARALYAIVSNQRMYLQGDTGSGKTTLVEQVAARLNWPFGRINFDSEITRMDLIGRDILKEGKTQFIDGFLPKYMSGPYILCFDEIDFVRPDVAYVMQAALEGNGLVITEDGGRRVMPHPMMRMFGTGNTVGQGDEKGMYQGARPQSLAFLDRFTIWAQVDYLDQKQRLNLLQKRVPSLTDDEYKTLIKYSEEHLTAFREGRVLQPISPRGIVALGRALAHFNTYYPKDKDNMHKALNMVVLDRATQADRVTLKGLVDRVQKS